MSLARWNALIRTHHITSRKKVARLKQAAADNDVLALLRSGGAPGIMYVEGMKADVEAWVAAVQVRYICLSPRYFFDALKIRSGG